MTTITISSTKVLQAAQHKFIDVEAICKNAHEKYAELSKNRSFSSFHIVMSAMDRWLAYDKVKSRVQSLITAAKLSDTMQLSLDDVTLLGKYLEE